MVQSLRLRMMSDSIKCMCWSVIHAQNFKSSIVLKCCITVTQIALQYNFGLNFLLFAVQEIFPTFIFTHGKIFFSLEYIENNKYYIL